MSKGLGRRRDPLVEQAVAKYPMRAVLPSRSSRTYRFWYQGGAWLDQGQTGTCVGHAFAHWLADGPVKQPNLVIDSGYAINLYCDACKIDPWPDNDGCNLNFGTSGRAAAEVLRGRGLISGYYWAKNIDDLITAVLDVGPVSVGTNWYADMFYPVIKYNYAYLTIGGKMVGGHQYVINGVNLNPMYGPPFFRMKNSWGRDWGHRGNARISIDDMDRLLFKEHGDACLATERQA